MKKSYVDTWGQARSYEVVTKIPQGFTLWNVHPVADADGYFLHVCEKLHPGNEEDFSINPETVKLLKIDKYHGEFLKGITSRHGISSLKNAKRIYSNKSVKNETRELARIAISIYAAITENEKPEKPYHEVIKLNINNGQELYITQTSADGDAIINKWDGDSMTYEYSIPAGDMVMLLNMYRYIKENDIQNDFINPYGKNKDN